MELLTKEIDFPVNTPAEAARATARLRLGPETPEAAIEAFLAPPGKFSNPLWQLPEVIKAGDLIDKTWRNSGKILFYGDYDCDGITALAQIQRFCQINNIPDSQVSFFFPVRFRHGYGITEQGLIDANLDGVSLLVAVDCGTNSAEAIHAVNDKGVATIIIDHHDLSGKPLPKESIHLNPKVMAHCDPDLLDVSASGLIALFLSGLSRAHGMSFDRDYSIMLAGVAAIGDSIPLVGWTRTLVKIAIEKLNCPEVVAASPGIHFLAGLCRGAVDSTSIAFKIVPRINAAGRLGDCTPAFDLLTCRNQAQSKDALDVLNAINDERKDIQIAAINLATRELGESPADKIIVYADKGLHPGVAGIVAAKISQKYQRPAFALGLAPEGRWQGSGRGFNGVCDVGKLASSAFRAGVSLAGGGHSEAAGVTVGADQLEAFRQHCNTVAADIRIGEAVTTVLGDITWFDSSGWVEFFTRLEPFGQANPRPLLYLPGVTIVGPPRELKTKADQTVWGWEARGRAAGVTYPLLLTDCEDADKLFRAGVKADLVVDFSWVNYGPKRFVQCRIEDYHLLP